jgi:hypothetical protein
LIAAGHGVTTNPRRPDSERLRADDTKTPLQVGSQAFWELLFGTGRREHTAHEPLISSVMVEEVPLAGLSFPYDTTPLTAEPVEGQTTTVDFELTSK